MSIPHFHVNPARKAGKRILSILPALALVATLAACDSNDREDFNISTYTGDPYTGSAEGTATSPGGEAEVFLLVTNAAIQVDSLSEGQASLTITQGGLPSFSAEGSYDANGASFTEGDDQIEIDADGTLRGDLTINGYQAVIQGDVSGSATSSSFDLETRTVLTEDVGDDPADTEVRLVLELNR